MSQLRPIISDRSLAYSFQNFVGSVFLVRATTIEIIKVSFLQESSKDYSTFFIKTVHQHTNCVRAGGEHCREPEHLRAVREEELQKRGPADQQSKPALQ